MNASNQTDPERRMAARGGEAEVDPPSQASPDAIPWPGPKPPPKGLGPRVWLYISILVSTFVLALWVAIWWSKRGGDSAEWSRVHEYAAGLAEVQGLIREGQRDRAASLLKARGTPTGRGWEWEYLGRLAVGEDPDRAVARHDLPINIKDAGWISEGDRAVLVHDRGAQVWDLSTHEILHAIPMIDTDDQAAIPAVGDWKMISVGGANRSVRIRGLGGGASEAAELGQQDLPIRTAAISSSGVLLACGSAAPSYEFVIWDLVTKKARVRTRNIKATALGWEPQGRGILIGTEEGAIICYRGTPWRIQFRMDAHPKGIVDVESSPAGAGYATIGGEGDVRLWDNWGRPIVSVSRGEGAAATDLTYSPDGGRLVIARADGSLEVIDAKTGISLLVIPSAEPDAPQRPVHARFDAAGDRLMVADGREIRILGRRPAADGEPALTAP